MANAPGTVTVLEGEHTLPFAVVRVFSLCGFPTRPEKRRRELKLCSALLIALAGSVDVLVRDAEQIRRIRLDRPQRALYVPLGVSRAVDRCSPDAVCLVLAGEMPDEPAYERGAATVQSAATG